MRGRVIPRSSLDSQAILSFLSVEQVDGRVTATEFQDEEGYYEVEVTKPDGSQVDVHLDENYNVIDAPSDGGGSDSQDGPNDGNESGG